MKKRAFVFDWDGTLVSCNKRIETVLSAFFIAYPSIEGRFLELLRKNVSPGWIRKGYIASLPEDLFSFEFGLLAQVLVEQSQSTGVDHAWSMILNRFKELYLANQSDLLVDKSSLIQLQKIGDIVVVSNSDTSNIQAEINRLGIDEVGIRLVGNAAKYKVDKTEPVACGVPVSRPQYNEVLTKLLSEYKSVQVIGDNFSCDLALPFSLGLQVHYVPNDYTPRVLKKFCLSNDIYMSNSKQVIENILKNYGGN